MGQVVKYLLYEHEGLGWIPRLNRELGLEMHTCESVAEEGKTARSLELSAQIFLLPQTGHRRHRLLLPPFIHNP